MFDSSAKIPDGFLMGTGKIMGQYGECIKVEHPEKLFDGQHCMLAITLNIDLGNITSDSPDYGDGGVSILKKINNNRYMQFFKNSYIFLIFKKV